MRAAARRCTARELSRRGADAGPAPPTSTPQLEPDEAEIAMRSSVGRISGPLSTATPALALLALLAVRGPAAAAPAPPPAVTQAQPEPFAEKVLVREIEVVVELPDPVRESRRKSLGPQDFQVLEDGGFRQLSKASPVAAEAGAWQVVLYFDRVLADAETVFFTANQLAQHAAQLTGLGAVEVVVADPQPRLALAGSREPKVVEQALIDLAAQADRQRSAAHRPAGGSSHGQGPPPGQPRAGGQERTPGRPGASAAGAARGVGPDLATIRRQEDRLVTTIAGRPTGGPRALVLVADGFDTSTSGDGASSATAAVAEEPARTLAAYGWITIAAPMRRQELGEEHRETTDLERIRQSTGGHATPGSTAPPEILPQAAPKSRLNYEGVLSLFVEPSSATLTAIASATGGTVVGFPQQLAATLTSLARRWHLFYLAPDPEDGRPRPVEVRLLPEGAVLRAPVWRRSSTPDEVSAARLRRLLDGAADRGTLEVAAAAGQPAPRSLRVTVRPFTAPNALPAGPFRISLAFAGPTLATPAVQHRLITRADLTEKGWTETLPLDPPPGARRLAVAVEDLNHQLWGATVVELP
jgi:hypothetical protein